LNKAINFGAKFSAGLAMPGMLIMPAAQSKEAVFEQVFKEHYKRLHAYAITILKDEVMGEEMVQQVFLKLWESGGMAQINGSVTGYLYRAVHNACLNHIKHQKVKQAYHHYVTTQQQHAATVETLTVKELQVRIDQALNDLPEQCRTIFQMSRFEQLKYQEIADRLQLSVKTVENQMGKALRILREKLSDYLPTVLIFLLLNGF